MRVLLVSGNTHTQPYPVYPIGLEYVAGAIADHHPVCIVDMNSQQNGQTLAEAIEDFDPELIGLSIRNIDTADANHPDGFLSDYQGLVAAIRAQTAVPLVLGGSGFAIFPEQLLHGLNGDYGIIGEGERLSVLLEALEGRGDVPPMPGILTRRSAAAVPGPWTGRITRRFVPGLPHVEFYLKRGGILNLQTKRGCGFNCIYCTYPLIEGHTLRLFDPQEVSRTARRLQEAGAKYIFVTDAAFNSDGAHSVAVAKAFKQAGVSIPWGAFFAPVSMDRDYFRVLADAGLKHVEFGTESLSDPVLKAYRKPFRAEHVFKAHTAAVEAGLHVAHYFLFGGPGESSDTLNETLQRIEHLDRCVLFLFCGMRVYPQTALEELVRQNGKGEDTRNLMESVFYHSEAIGVEEILDRVRRQARGRLNWIIGDGGEPAARALDRMHSRGHTGPLWEHLIR
jgi:radical SAM superfamily enzyme YgiQ (UPF0313 family)